MGINKTLKRRFADARNNSNIIKSQYKNKEFNNLEFIGNISLLEIEKVKENWYVDEENRCIFFYIFTFCGSVCVRF